ncbi:hypothetical protein LTR62_006184 [Meristemomyces frigidus]|uniref:DNA-directed DNA polymerase n=1 Tax=Meristemomyces frigidus TaxID=1508187 RepID=A0AAN7TEN3_9PEZI|nr:hypothetical protein LTR62_006184 [Meristemomyces frigidus]
MSSPPSSQTLQNDSQATEVPPLDLSSLPPIFVSATHLALEDLHELENELIATGAKLTYDVSEMRIVLTKVVSKKRITIDLRAKGLWTEEVQRAGSVLSNAVMLDGGSEMKDEGGERPAKRRRVEDGKSAAAAIILDDDVTIPEREFGSSEVLNISAKATSPTKARNNVATAAEKLDNDSNVIKVVKIEWFEESQKAGEMKPLDDYLTYTCRGVEKPSSSIPVTNRSTPAKQVVNISSSTTPHKPPSSTLHSSPSNRTAILERAKEDAIDTTSQATDRFGKRRFNHHQTASTTDATWAAGHHEKVFHAHLLTKTTTENDNGVSSDMPEMPDWVKQGVKYSCQRQSPLSGPNDTFIGLLKKIRLARTLTEDEIGVRAYSSSIASLAAYPHRVSNPREVMALPGCDAKIANLFVEFANTGFIQAVEDLEADEDMKVLRQFYEIWGVGATTAREFFFQSGWRDLDDIVEYGWNTLSRVQQIGVKYYDEFLDLIPRREVEDIAKTIHRHAVLVRDEAIQSQLVGGYRRGKPACGDVDIILSHPDETQTLHLVNDVVASLEQEGWITHTLVLALTNSKRDQETLPYRSREGPSGSHGGFDTLDKALVVWQDPVWSSKSSDEALAAKEGTKVKNPNIHRRVDIIIAPWRSVGCAVAGWSGGTTFQRDIRRYAKNVKGWKFDSSGIRDRVRGEVVDVEGFLNNWESGRAGDMVEAERRVFEGLGLPFVEAEMRNTG